MRISFETGRNFSTFLAARLVFATVLLGVAALFRSGSGNLWAYLALFIANTALSLSCAAWLRKRPPGTTLRWFTLTSAVVLDTLILRSTGGVRGEFLFLYFFSIGSAGLLTGVGGSVWTALLSSAGLAWLYWATSEQFLAEHGLHTFVYAINFCLTAVLSSYVFARLQERERTHQRTLGELEQTRLDTQAILDSLTSGVVVLGVEQNVRYFNPSCASILNLGMFANAAEVAQVIRADTGFGEAFRVCLRNLDCNARSEIEVTLPGSNKPVGLELSALWESGGESRGHILLLTDLSKRKEAERTERERERLADLGRLSQDLAHEIRNPLATVRGCVEMIKISESERSEMTPYLELALKESDRLNSLLRDFLHFAHLGTPRKQAGELRELIRSRSRDARIGLNVTELLPDKIPAEFDGDQLTLVIETILLSLAEWAEGHGEIRIEKGIRLDGSVRFLLSETCVPADARAAAFRPFSDSNRLSNGLALPTAMRAIHAHGGKLTLDSEPGVGTWFELAL